MRKLTPLVAASSFATLLATIPQAGYALGLGKLSVESDLGEPLQLVIQLDSVSAAEAETLDIGLGSRSDFTRANVEYPELGEQLEFNLIKGDDGGYRVEITTNDPVQEAYLHFLVTVNWSGGKAVREYTALLDPPLYSGNAAATVSLAGDEPADAEEQTTDAETVAEAIEAVEAAVSDSGATPLSDLISTSSSGDEGGETIGRSITVNTGDTLSQIVNDITKPEGVDYFQALEAVYRKNPKAFIDSNMNLLRSGATLEVPSFEEMRAISRGESVASFNEQLARFNAYRGRVAEQQETASSDTLNELIQDVDEEADTDVAEQETAALETETPAPEIEESTASVEEAITDLLAEQEVEPTLTVGQDVETDAIVGADDNAAQIEALKQQLALLDENLLASGVQSETVRDNLQNIQSQVDRISTLIEIEDTSLANLQDNLTSEEAPANLADPESGEVAASDTGTESDAVAAKSEETLEQQIDLVSTEVEEVIAEIDQTAIDESQEVAVAVIDTAQQALDEAVNQSATVASSSDTDSATGVDPEASVEEQVAIESDDNIIADAQTSQEVAAVAALPATDATGTDDDIEDAAGSAVRKVSESGLLDSVKNAFSSLPEYGLKIAAGLLALLLGLFLWQRNKTRREYDASMLDIETEEVSLNSEASIQRMSDASGIDLASANDSALELTIGGGMSYLSEQGITGVNEEENEVIKAGAVDPLAEADVYLAYDRDEQAVQVLKEAYVDNPERGELAEKLLEIYHKQDDRRAFDELAAELHQQSDSTQNISWERVVSMGREVSPDNPLYSGDASPQTASTGSSSSDSELDLDDDLMAETPKPSAAASAGLSLNDSGLDMLSLGADTSATAVNALEIDDLDIDLTPPKKESGGGAADAPTLSQIINENVEGKLSMDDTDDDGEINLDDGNLQLDLGSDDSQFNRIEEESKMAVEESDSPDSVPLAETGGLDQASVMSEMTESSMSQLEPYHESETALELAKAYMELGEQEIAKGFIEEVLNEGSEKQKGKARSLIKELTS